MLPQSFRMTLAMILSAFSGVLLGQATPTAAPPATAAAPSDLKFELMDGSIVAGKPSIPELSVETRFGTLKVPFDQIRSFTPGLTSHPALEQKITGYINDLGAEAFADREKAQQALFKIGPELKPELERQVKTSDAEKQNRLQKLIDDFDDMRDEDADTSRDWAPNDVIVTQGFTIVGHITTPGFAVNSNYGSLQIKLADVRQARRESLAPEELRKTFSVSGNVMATHTFTNAGIRLNKGDQVSITASGSVTLTPWGNNAQSGPDGARNYGVMQPGNLFTGTLIARIAGGEATKIGAKSSFTAPKAGPIEFSIAIPGDYNGSNFPGEYEVKIRVTRKR